ncbi:MAG TPA: efflux RND transporter periplasmic adaptor subunit [Gemmatimonadales bacterium]
MKTSLKWMAAAGGAALAVAGAAALFRPAQVAVDGARVVRGPLVVTVDEEGETRVRDRYVVAAPVGGRVARIALREGDAVGPGAVVAHVFPAPLDARTREQAAARVEAAEDAQRAAVVAVAQARAAYQQAQRSCERVQQLAAAGLVPPEERERAELEETSRQRELESAEFRAQAAAHDVDAARSALLGGTGTAVPLRSPIRGRVLRIPERSERVVAAGTPLMEIGDPAKIEIVADLLSSDAVRVRPGAAMWIEGWGGDTALQGRLRVIEPSGFTKISALGVEEQRVNVIGDLMNATAALGDRYRVEIRIVVWEASDVLKVPVSALFRSGDAWAVFVIEDGRARLRPVDLGHRNAFEAEIAGGLVEGAVVIRHPSDRVSEGTRVR